MNPGELPESVIRVSTGPRPDTEFLLLSVPMIHGWFASSIFAVLIGSVVWTITAGIVGNWRTRYLIVVSSGAVHVLRCRRYTNRPTAIEATYGREFGIGTILDRRRLLFAGTTYWMDEGPREVRRSARLLNAA